MGSVSQAKSPGSRLKTTRAPHLPALAACSWGVWKKPKQGGKKRFKGQGRDMAGLSFCIVDHSCFFFHTQCDGNGFVVGSPPSVMSGTSIVTPFRSCR